MIAFINKLNNLIVLIILIPVYFIIFGLAFIIHRLTAKKRDTSKTYWEKPQITSDFTSPY